MKYIVEYDPDYYGGNYKDVGNFVDVMADDDAQVPEAFREKTGKDPVHIVHFTVDEDYEAE